MIKLLKLYSVPESFTPITFDSGINLILGEKVPEEEAKTRKDRKTNGVGKSMCIEFINFCLMKDSGSSRVMKIPFDKFADDIKIKLDLSVGEQKITIVRSKSESEKPVIESDENVIPFSSIKDALDYLGELFYKNQPKTDLEKPSFRDLISPLIRDESSEFKDIVGCHDIRARIPNIELITPHLYFFNIDSSIVKEIKSVMKELEAQSKTYAYINSRLTDNGKKRLSDVKAEINGLEREMEKAHTSLEKFESEPAFQQNQDEIIQLDKEIEELRTKQSVLKIEIKRIEDMPKLEAVETADIEIVYNKFKSGLGDLVSKSLEEVFEFKKKIEVYQDKLINEKAKLLREEVSLVLRHITELDVKRGKLLQNLDNVGFLKDFKNGFSIYNKRKDELLSTVSNLQEYGALERKISALKLKKDSLFADLDAEIFNVESTIKSFTQTLVSIHEYIMGSAEVSFEIKTHNRGKNKQIISPECRIPDDGSHSVDRTKVFMYDVGLMLNEITKQRHPQFLIHDNIFDVDQDTLVQSLNFLSDQEKNGQSFQYILTLNRDKIETEERRGQISLDIDTHTKASFSRQNTFLKTRYQEL